MQGEPRFDRLKRDLEDVKNQPRGLEGTFRTAAEMERHRAQLADAAIEEQLEVQTAFREHGAHLQVGAQLLWTGPAKPSGMLWKGRLEPSA